MDRKYKNTASKALTWLIIFFSLVALTISLVLTFVIGNDNTFVLIFFISLGVLEVPAILVPFIIMSSSRQTRRGKNKYELMMKKYSSLAHTHLIKNYEIDKDHKIENILITPYNVYLITSITYEGVINGMDSDVNWTQALKSQATRNAIPNPVKENMNLIELLKSKKKLDIDIVPVIVLLSSNRGYIISKYLYSPIQFESLITPSMKERYTPKEVETIYMNLTK